MNDEYPAIAKRANVLLIPAALKGALTNHAMMKVINENIFVFIFTKLEMAADRISLLRNAPPL
ncbi:MAG: hypothetical protein V2B19_03055 [Pseudomonadota bacterium]